LAPTIFILFPPLAQVSFLQQKELEDLEVLDEEEEELDFAGAGQRRRGAAQFGQFNLEGGMLDTRPDMETC